MRVLVYKTRCQLLDDSLQLPAASEFGHFTVFSSVIINYPVDILVLL